MNNSKLDDKLEYVLDRIDDYAMALDHLRYEVVRKLNPNQFAALWHDCIANDKRFDNEIDNLVIQRL